MDYYLCKKSEEKFISFDYVPLYNIYCLLLHDNGTEFVYLMICIGGVYGFSTLIDSRNECRFSQSAVPVFGSSKHKSGISFVDCTPALVGRKRIIHYIFVSSKPGRFL